MIHCDSLLISRCGCHLAVAVVLAFLVSGALRAQEQSTFPNGAKSGFASRREATEEKNSPSKSRLREGTVITNQTGHFRQEGEGAVFITDKKHELSALPNLSLERVSRTLKGFDEPETIQWKISGVVTEFNGRNYLLINRAVYKSSVPPPAPLQLAN